MEHVLQILTLLRFLIVPVDATFSKLQLFFRFLIEHVAVMNGFSLGEHETAVTRSRNFKLLNEYVASTENGMRHLRSVLVRS
jgi:hypothetical protein